MEKKENTLFVERFRPTTLEHFVGNQTVKETLQKYPDQRAILAEGYSLMKFPCLSN